MLIPDDGDAVDAKMMLMPDDGDAVGLLVLMFSN